MEENKIIACQLFGNRNNQQVNYLSWCLEEIAENTWELSTHKRYLEMADKLLSVTDFKTIMKIINTNVLNVE